MDDDDDVLILSGPCSEPGWTKADHLAGIDGRFPDVVYSLKRYGRDGRLVDRLVRDTPFDDEFCGLLSSRDAGQGPALEIVTRAFREASCRGRLPTGISHPYDSEDEAEDDTHSQTIIIHSDHLINALQAVIEYDADLSMTNPLRISAPFQSLYHHRRELSDYRNRQPSTHGPDKAATTSRHIDVLLGFLETHLGEGVRREEERHKLSPPLATFDLFWLLIKPGTIIYAKRQAVWTAYVVSGITMPRNQTDGYSVSAWLLESDGNRLRRLEEVHSVPRWRDERPVGTLPVIPARLWPEDWDAQAGRSMRDKQIDQGRLYWELLQRPRYMLYDGSQLDDDDTNGLTKSRVICDGAGLDKFYDDRPQPPGWPRPLPQHPTPSIRRNPLPHGAPRCRCRACNLQRPGSKERGPLDGFDDLDPVNDRPPDGNDSFFLVCSKLIPAFILDTRRWARLHVSKLRAVHPDVDAFRHLVLDDDVKHTMQALVLQSTALVKAENRILLLYGPPGVGKTSTAECLAKQMNRPLLKLTSHDLGLSTGESLLHTRLTYFLTLAQRYGAILLLTEAELYLQNHASQIPSLLLTTLESHPGPVLLTTSHTHARSFNRTALSRIHLALPFRDVAHDARRRRHVCKAVCDGLVSEAAGRLLFSDEARAFMNQLGDGFLDSGREVRNVLLCARAMARSEMVGGGDGVVVVCERHLRPVAELSRRFKREAAAVEIDE
ncbi:hypothetical protein GQ602_002306 [Ophiocordyceps camponoti-floridani]|uniref:AAA+ ATPase domain-containing protein n=1 Tax=Ophiocordyceps camponoti-floridani TaxID=2030778 RepID=A0A8H4QA79_9HYPO|nr:hypothetical protein GQ602_002306 [Ophiocordyceps camponoti-floridani]